MTLPVRTVLWPNKSIKIKGLGGHTSAGNTDICSNLALKSNSLETDSLA